MTTLEHDDLLARFGIDDAGAELAEGADLTSSTAIRRAEMVRRRAAAERAADARAEAVRAQRNDRIESLADLALAALAALNDRHPDCPAPRRPGADFTPTWCREQAVRLRSWHEAPDVDTTRAAWLARYGWTTEDVETALGEPAHLAMLSRAWPELRRAIVDGTAKPGERFRPLVERLRAANRKLRAELWALKGAA